MERTLLTRWGLGERPMFSTAPWVARSLSAGMVLAQDTAFEGREEVTASWAEERGTGPQGR